MAAKRRARSGAGLGVDFSGGPVIDPTENVKALSEALSQRQDDLRDLNNKYLDARLKALGDIAKLRAEHAKDIRQVDIQNAAATAAQLLSGVQTLASTTQTTAETLRAAVANTATTIANQTERVVSTITDRIGVLEKASYRGEGKQTVADPAMERLSEQVRALVTLQSSGAGKSAGANAMWGYIVGALGLLLTVLMLFDRFSK